MANMRRVALCGSSLLLSSIGASLKNRAELRVLEVEEGLSTAEQQERALRADAVVFDLTAVPRDWPLELLRARPDLLLIGVDLATDRAFVLSGRYTRLWTAGDLVQLIESVPAGDQPANRETS